MKTTLTDSLHLEIYSSWRVLRKMMHHAGSTKAKNLNSLPDVWEALHHLNHRYFGNSPKYSECQFRRRYQSVLCFQQTARLSDWPWNIFAAHTCVAEERYSIQEEISESSANAFVQQCRRRHLRIFADVRQFCTALFRTILRGSYKLLRWRVLAASDKRKQATHPSNWNGPRFFLFSL